DDVEIGDRVSVIGGGDVAVDSARTALKLGAKEVTILYRRSRDEMPANPWETKEAEKEGVGIKFLVAPERITGENGKATKIECIRLELGELDNTGRRRPVPIQGSEFTVETDAVIVAIGQAPNLAFLPEGVEVTRRRTIAVSPFTSETSLPGFFAGGDVTSGPASVMEAIIAGKQAAVSVDHYLKLETSEPQQIVERC
ncbi:MAG: FAD-dependent oxidoreductase, partial [Candidatus Bathyarchaeota archaeon]|nr:FAD-dependent oxidoreductase [Candidatus Bathyarchaeota archaeon]